MSANLWHGLLPNLSQSPSKDKHDLESESWIFQDLEYQRISIGIGYRVFRKLRFSEVYYNRGSQPIYSVFRNRFFSRFKSTPVSDGFRRPRESAGLFGFSELRRMAVYKYRGFRRFDKSE